MEEYYDLLRKSSIFTDMEDEEMNILMRCLSPELSHYRKNEYILRCGESTSSFGILLKGMAMIEKYDLWGNLNILSEVSIGMSFAESYACLPDAPSDVHIIAKEDSDIMFFDIGRFLYICPIACKFHNRLVQNLLTEIAKKNLLLTRKIDFISKKKIRDRLLSYLQLEAQKNESDIFEIPFNRQELADFLLVDRSALSSEIGKLQNEGIISCKKNLFRIIIRHTY